MPTLDVSNSAAMFHPCCLVSGTSLHGDARSSPFVGEFMEIYDTCAKQATIDCVLDVYIAAYIAAYLILAARVVLVLALVSIRRDTR